MNNGVMVRALTETEVNEGFLPASEVETYNPDRYSFRWNSDYSGFIPRKLAWHDDASYIRYQCMDMDEE